MPQEIRVVQCFECKIYQSDLVKKAKKWTCKVCNAKQSLQRVFLCGSGPECRARVQELNKQREMNELSDDKLAEKQLQQQPPLVKLENKNPVSKWSKFVDKSEEAAGKSSDKLHKDMDNLFCFQNKQKWTSSKFEPSQGIKKRSSLENSVKQSKKLCKWDAYI